VTADVYLGVSIVMLRIIFVLLCVYIRSSIKAVRTRFS